MGFLDRFSRESNTPDALTSEVVARIRALATVDRAEAVDGDTVSVTWAGRREADEIHIGDIRPEWKQAKGFDRIELLDDFIARLSSGGSAATTDTGVPDLGLADPVGWSEVRGDLLPVLRRRRSADDGALTWPVGTLLDATASRPGAEPVTAAQCELWGLEPGEVRTAALTNLRGIDPAPDAIGARAWVPTGPVGLPSSWLAAGGVLLDRLGLDSGIVLAPLRSELVVVDPADADAVRSILDSTLTIVESRSDTLCPVPFLVTGDEVDVWHPADAHPAAELVQRTHELFPT